VTVHMSARADPRNLKIRGVVVGHGRVGSARSGFHRCWKSSSELPVCPTAVRKKNPHRWRVIAIGTSSEREPTMNQISTLKDAVDDGKTAADDLEYGRHAVPQVKDPDDYHGKHRSDDADLRNIA
jgi:hypothetical protein